CFDLLGLFTAETHCYQVVCVPHHHGGARHRPSGSHAELVISDSRSLLHPMEGHVQQQRGNDPTLWGSLLGRSESPFVDHARFQPSLDQSPCWETAESAENVGVVDPVERVGDTLPTSTTCRR